MRGAIEEAEWTVAQTQGKRRDRSQANLHFARNVIPTLFNRLRHRKLNDASRLQAGANALAPASPRHQVGQARARITSDTVPTPRKSGADREFCLIISVNGGDRWADPEAGAAGAARRRKRQNIAPHSTCGDCIETGCFNLVDPSSRIGDRTASWSQRSWLQSQRTGSFCRTSV